MDENVNSVIEALKRLYDSLQAKQAIENKETQTFFEEKRQLSGFNIFPKKLLRKTFLFLDFNLDIPQILLTCKLFNGVVKSRTFQVLLHTQVALKNTKLYNNPLASAQPELEMIKLKPESEITTKEDAISQLKLANAARDFLADNLKKKAKKIDDLEKEISTLQEEMKNQKNLYTKGIEKMNAFEKMLENEKKNLADAQKNLVAVQVQNKFEIEALKAQISNSEKDRNELQVKKAQLKGQVLKLRSENVQIYKKIAVFQEVLSKIKAYFDGMQEAKLLKPLESFK